MPLFLSTITVVLLFSNIGYYISYIRVKRKLKALKEKNQQIKNINISLERDNCFSTSCNVGWVADKGNWSGASNSNSQSNHTTFRIRDQVNKNINENQIEMIEKKMVMILLGLVIVGMVIAYIKLEKTNNKLKQEYQQLKNINISLERDIRDQANKNIILESLLKQRPNQNEDRKIY